MLFNFNLHQLNQTFLSSGEGIYIPWAPAKFLNLSIVILIFSTVKVGRTSQYFIYPKTYLPSHERKCSFVAQNLVVVPLYIFHSFTDLATEISKADMKVFVLI
mgnify:CR=1 FL=1